MSRGGERLMNKERFPGTLHVPLLQTNGSTCQQDRRNVGHGRHHLTLQLHWLVERLPNLHPRWREREAEGGLVLACSRSRFSSRDSLIHLPDYLTSSYVSSAEQKGGVADQMRWVV